MVFLVAYPTQGRQIQPTLEFLYAGDLPIYATSAIYSGTPDPARDRDLGDIRFNASPWTLTDPGQLSPRPDDRLPQAHRQLFALGVDSYLLHAQLADGMPGLAQPVYGQTGLLMMDGNGRVMRLQPWARFRNGRAAPLSPAEPGT
jgi:outer membrane PBP1 activator LpoA protein